MLADKFLRDELTSLLSTFIQQSRSNLSKGKKNASKELYNSLGYQVSQAHKQRLWLLKWLIMASFKIGVLGVQMLTMLMQTQVVVLMLLNQKGGKKRFKRYATAKGF